MTDRDFVRHSLASLAYRAAKTIRGAPETFSAFRPGPESKSAAEIVAHMGDLFDWALSMAEGQQRWNSSTPQSWALECARFFDSLRKFDGYLASHQEVHYDLTRLFQGPIADALTHTGQLAMMRRLHGAPMRGESYNRADVAAGRIGMEQTPPDPKFEFD